MGWYGRIACIIILVALAPGCVTSMGSRALPKVRFNYNEAITRSWNEQMLLNLVRLRYRDTPQFLEISNVLTQFSFDARASADTSVQLEGGVDRVGVFGSIGYAERPTVTYVPLQGENFARRFLSPLDPATIALLSQSGWSIERLMLCCVHQINDLRNAPSAAGPTPDYVPRFGAFHEASGIFRDLQVAGVTQAAVRRRDGKDSIVIRFSPEGEMGERLARLKQLLGLAGGRNEFAITTSTLDRTEDQMTLVGRSLMGTLFFLSQAVEPPAIHEEQGKVTVTRDSEGDVFDWSTVVGPLLRVRSQVEDPEHAFVKVHYRGHWFFIGDSDLNSKTTFGLLKYLFSLQSGPPGASPLLTVTAGG